MSDAVTIAPGLHRWTAWHDDWEEDVASVAVETTDGLVVIDPLDPPPQFARPGAPPDHRVLARPQRRKRRG